MSDNTGNTNIMSYVKSLPSEAAIIVGAASGFFYAGTAEEFIRNIDEIECGINFCNVKREGRGNRTPLRERNMISAYERISESGIAIIVEGYELGGFWTSDEFARTISEHDGSFIDTCRHSKRLTSA